MAEPGGHTSCLLQRMWQYLHQPRSAVRTHLLSRNVSGANSRLSASHLASRSRLCQATAALHKNEKRFVNRRCAYSNFLTRPT